MSVLEQKQATENVSDCESDFSTLAEHSRDRYSCKIYDQFAKRVEPMITNDCIDNYIFRDDHNLCHSNTSLSSSLKHFSEEEVIVFDDHKRTRRSSIFWQRSNH